MVWCVRSGGSKLLFVAASTALALVACSGGDDSTADTPTPVASARAATISAPSAGPTGSVLSGEAAVAFQVVHDTLDKINTGDVDGAYANLSRDAQRDISLPDAKRIIGGLQTAGVDLSLTIAEVGTAVVMGDIAEIEVTVRVKFGDVDVPVQDEASLVKEGGEWKLADHFLQTALTALGITEPATGIRVVDDNGCATGDPMEGVYAPARLKILDRCFTVTGVVADDINKALDGDITFGLILDDVDKRLINDVNVANYHGNLHIEIVPFDQGRVLTPKPGDTITVTGPWVTDLAHGHNEIHPAFVIMEQ